MISEYEAEFGSFRSGGNCVRLVGPKDLQRLCRSVLYRNFCKLFSHALCVATDSRTAVRDDPVVIGVDRGDDAVEGREFEIGKADSHGHSVFRAGRNRVDALPP